MPIIRILPHPDLSPEGMQFEVSPGANLCEALLNHGINIEHACEMSCACTTCHVVIKQGFQSLEEPTEKEEDLLDMAWGLTPVSRLSCQTAIGDTDLTVELPKYTLNHAREHH